MDLLLDIGMQLGTDVLQSEITRMTFAFMLAARLHRQWVKKDMAEFRDTIAGSINHLSDVMGRRIDGLDKRMDRIEEKMK